MNKIKKLLAFIGVLAMCIALIPVYYAKADEQASISISSASGTVGSTITVTVTISASDVIDAASVPVSYDNSIIKPVGAGNSGVVSFALLDASAYGSNESISMQFEVIAAGTTTLSVAGDAKISVNGERATVSIREGNSKSSSQLFLRQHIKVPADKSGNAYTSIFTRQDNIQCNC